MGVINLVAVCVIVRCDEIKIETFRTDEVEINQVRVTLAKNEILIIIMNKLGKLVSNSQQATKAFGLSNFSLRNSKMGLDTWQLSQSYFGS